MRYIGILKYEDFKRVYVVGTVIKIIDKGKYIDVIVNNGIENFTIRIFENELFNFPSLEEGQSILVLGKVKEFRGKKYIHPDFLVVIEPEVEILLKIPIIKKYLSRGIKIETREKREEDKTVEKRKVVDIRKAVLEILEREDRGEGVDINVLYEKIDANPEEIERVVEELKLYGFIYEPQPGKLKILK